MSYDQKTSYLVKSKKGCIAGVFGDRDLVKKFSKP